MAAGLPRGWAVMVKRVGLVWADQRAGELVYVRRDTAEIPPRSSIPPITPGAQVPRGWWHTTLAIEPCLAFTQNLVLPRDAREALHALDAAPGQAAAAAALRAAIAERHTDLST